MQVEALRKTADELHHNLSRSENKVEEFKKRLEGLRAAHSAVPQAEASRNRGGPVRREPVETEVC